MESRITKGDMTQKLVCLYSLSFLKSDSYMESVLQVYYNKASWKQCSKNIS